MAAGTSIVIPVLPRVWCWQEAVSDPLRALRRVAIIAICSVLIGTAIPSVVAYRAGTFYYSQMKALLDQKRIPEVINHESNLAKLQQMVKLSENALGSALTDNRNNLQDLLRTREYYAQEVVKAERDITLAPLFLNTLMLMWTAVYFCLGCLSFVMNPEGPKNGGVAFTRVATALAVPYLLYQSPVWLRNFVLNNEGRRVFSFANHDISASSFYMQEVNTLVAFLLLSIVWQRWTAHLQACRTSMAPAMNATSAEDGLQLTRMFAHWQLSSILLALAFIPFTGAFWELVVTRKDQRYIIPAIVIHAVWGVSWIILSLPIVVVGFAWYRSRQEAIASLYLSPDANVEVKMDVLNQLTPIALWNVAASGVAAIVSFLFPLIKPLLA